MNILQRFRLQLKVSLQGNPPGILSICLFSAMLTAGCSSDHQYADIILSNGKIITVDERFSIAEAVAIRDGRFLAVGDNEEILELAGDSTKVIDLAGRAVIPGLIEGHAHPIGASRSEYFAPIPEVNTIHDVLTWIGKEAIAKKKNEWIIHPKFFITRLRDMRQLTLHELDSVAPDNPVFLNGSYGGMINSKAMEVSGMIGSKHAGILRDVKTGKPLGAIRRSAFSLLKVPDGEPMTDQEKFTALKQLFHLYNSIGITSVTSGGGNARELETYQDLQNKGELTVRIFQNIRLPFSPKISLDEMRSQLASFGHKTGDGDEWVKVGALKVTLDGGMLTGTAFLHEGWGEEAREIYGITDPEYRGELFISGKELINVITASDEAGWKFTAHVTGGAGVDTLLAAYEAVNQTSPIKDKRFSIIHGNFFTPQAIEKMAAMGVYADMQPAWFYKDTDLLDKVLGEERIKNFHPYNSLMQAGVVVNGGSDHMVKLDPNAAINPYNPFTSMWSVVTRKTDRGTVFNSGEAISREQALKMYTINNAYASFEEKIKGSIEKGKLADLVVLSHDILTCPVDTILEITPELTMVNGKNVFEKAESLQ